MFEEIKSLLQRIIESLARIEKSNTDILAQLKVKTFDQQAQTELLEKIRTDTDIIKQKVQF